MVSIEDAKEFVVAKQLIPENEVKILGASVSNDISSRFFSARAF